MEERSLNSHCWLLLALGLPFHLLLLLGANDPSGWLGPRDSLGTAGTTTVVGYVLFTIFIYLMTRKHQTQTPGILAAVTAFVPLPAEMLMFPVDAGLSLTGIVACVIQAWFLVRFSAADEAGSPFERNAGEESEDTRIRAVDLVLISGAGAVAVALLVNGHGIVGGIAGWAAAVCFLALTVGFSLHAERCYLSTTLRHRPYATHALLVLALFLMIVPGCFLAVIPVLALRQMSVAVGTWIRERGGHSLWVYLTERPAHLLVISFGAAIVAGAVLLSLPAASNLPGGLSALDALFTSTSATCVTGLIVVDTGTDLTLLGQLIVLLLIQVGGLGIMTISIFLALLLGKSVGLRAEFALGEMIGEERTRTALRLLRFIVGVTLCIEAAGALVLGIEFARMGYPGGRCVYYGIFHSISAFCNAGFALFSDSLVGFSDRFILPFTVSLLIIVGGLGFGVLAYFVGFRQRRTTLTPHIRIVLAMTAILGLGGTIAIWVFECDHALAHMMPLQAASNAWFQSITTRTAGFNTMDLTTLSPASILLMTLLMFIGAAPGSTGGGVKVTTFAILLLVVGSVLKGRKRVIVFGRKIEYQTVQNAVALMVLGGLVLVVSCLVLFVTQSLPPKDLIFEAVSAFGTVGLSLGITASLTPIGKLLIVGLMFMGRVGPLTLLVMMGSRQRSKVDYPEARVMIG